MKAGWKRTSLGRQFKTSTGSTPSKSDPAFFGGPIPLVKPPELLDGDIFGAADSLTELGAAEARLLPVDSVLVSCIGILGKVGIARVAISFNQQINAILPSPNDADPKFMFYQALSPFFREQLFARSSGTTVAIVNKSKFNEIEIVLPPLEEQRRIVAVLDKSFAGIATATANAQKNLTNARALFESSLASTVAEASASCPLVPLSELTTDITDGDHLPPPKSETGVPFITIGNIDKKSRIINFGSTFRVSHGYFNALKANRKPRQGDVLYTVTGSFGIPVLVENDYEFCFQRHIGLIRPKPSTDSRWLNYVLLSPQVFEQAYNGATGTAQKTVSLKVLRNIMVPKVDIADQRTAVIELDALSEKTNRLEFSYNAKLAALTELKQSLLQKAFAGELT